MSTRSIPPQPGLPDDPGPWSGILDVLQRRGMRPGRRRAEPPNGLMIMPPPHTELELAGFDPSLGIAGTDRVKVISAAREPALGLTTLDGDRIQGIARLITRTWALSDLKLVGEDRSETDPAANLPPAAVLSDLADGELPASAVLAPGGQVAIVPVYETPRIYSLVILRTQDRGICRVIRWARAGTWSQDGKLLVIGGEWGLLALEHAVVAGGE